MVDLSINGDDIDAISRTAQSEVGAWKDRMDLYNGVRGVVYTIMNRAAVGGYGNTAGDIESTVNAKNAFSAISGNAKSAGSWNNLPSANSAVQSIVADRLKELSMGAPTRGFTHFGNPEQIAKDYAAGKNVSKATLDRSLALRDDPNSFSVGAIGNRHTYGHSPGPLERGFAVKLERDASMMVDSLSKNFDFGSPNELTRAANWDKVSSPTEQDYGTHYGDLGLRDASAKPEEMDFGPPVMGDTIAQTSAPFGAVSFGDALPDITPSQGFSESVFGGQQPSFASDMSDGGFHGSTPQGFGGFGQTGAVDQGDWSDRGFQSVASQQQSSFSPTVSDYGFSSMQPSAAQNQLGNQLSQQYRDTPPSMGYETPAARPMDRPTVAAPNAISTGDTYGFAPGFATTPIGTMGTTPLSSATMAASFGLTPSAPTEETPTTVGGFAELPPEVPAPNFAVAAPKAPTFATAPVAPKAPAPIAKPPAPIAPPKAPATFSAAPAAQQAAPTPSAPVDFSTAFNGLWGPNAAANRGAFSNQTGMNSATMNALTSAYDSGGMLTGAAYSGLMDAFNSPKTASSPPAIDFTANAVQPVFAAPIADLTNLVSNPGGNNLDSQGGIVGSYTAGGGLYGGSINDPREMAGYGWGGFGGSSSTDGTNPGLR